MSKKTVREILTPKIKTLVSLLSRNLTKDTTQDELEALIDQEIFNFEYRFSLNPDLYDCEEMSIEAAFRKVIMQNLSFDQDFGLVWMIPRNTKIGGSVVKILECKPTTNGKISMYRQAGSLIDLKAPKIDFDPITGQVNKVTIGLIVPRYGSDGNLISQDVKELHFDKGDFKQWQTYAHKLKSSKSNPGNPNTLNLSSELYWGHKPIKDAKGDPNPENPGGIFPSFAITKCTGHALKRANLDMNPYAKRTPLLPYQNKKYVEDIPADEDDVNYNAFIAPDFPLEEAEKQDTATLKEDVSTKKEVKEAIPPLKTTQESVKNANDKAHTDYVERVLIEMESCTTKAEALLIYNKHKSAMDLDPKFKSAAMAIGKRKADEEAAKNQPKKEEEIIDENNI